MFLTISVFKRGRKQNISLSPLFRFQALLARRGRAAAPPAAATAAGAAAAAAAGVAAPAAADSLIAPRFPSPQPQTSERHPRSSNVTKKTSAAEATCFSVLPCGRASTFGLARAMPETATRVKPAVEKSLEERVAVVVVVELLKVFFRERGKRRRSEKESGDDGDGDGKFKLTTHPNPTRFDQSAALFPLIAMRQGKTAMKASSRESQLGCTWPWRRDGKESGTRIVGT